MNSACPTCGTEYAVTPADVGRKIGCAKCGTALTVADSGLIPAPVPAPKAPQPLVPPRIAAWWRTADKATLAFAVGSLLVVYFLFVPQIESAKVDYRTARLAELGADHAAAVRTMTEQKADAQKIKDAEDKWTKRREELQDEVKSAGFSRDKAKYWDRYGLLLGYLLLAGASVAILRGEQPLVMRIVAAVVLTAQLLGLAALAPSGCTPSAKAYNLAERAPAIPEPKQ